MSQVEDHAMAVLNGEAHKVGELRMALRELLTHTEVVVDQLRELLEDDNGATGELAARALSLVLRLRAEKEPPA